MAMLMLLAFYWQVQHIAKRGQLSSVSGGNEQGRVEEQTSMSLFLFHERVGDFFVVLFFLGVEGIVVWFRFGRFLV